MSDYDTGRKDIGQDLNLLVVWEIGLVFALVCLVTTIFLYGLFLRTEQSEIAVKIYETQDIRVAEAVQNQINEINTHGWVDPELGYVSIPITEAMESTATELSRERYTTARMTVLDADSADTESAKLAADANADADPAADTTESDSPEHPDVDEGAGH